MNSEIRHYELTCILLLSRVIVPLQIQSQPTPIDSWSPPRSNSQLIVADANTPTVSMVVWGGGG